MASTTFGPFRLKPTFGFFGEGHESPPSDFLGKVLVSQTLRREHNLNLKPLIKTFLSLLRRMGRKTNTMTNKGNGKVAKSVDCIHVMKYTIVGTYNIQFTLAPL